MKGIKDLYVPVYDNAKGLSVHQSRLSVSCILLKVKVHAVYMYTCTSTCMLISMTLS